MKYLVGIDLGTTNTVMYYHDLEAEDSQPQIFKVLQLTESGETESRDSLPSFLYLPEDGELPQGALALPWAPENSVAIGEFARKCAPKLPNKVIVSTKSWLCAENIDRNAAILPWHRENQDKKLSPVEASRRIIAHLQAAWNQIMAANDPDNRLENQTVILTVPASFDAVARELTVNAAREAGLQVVLLEEPLAAFYAWLHEHESDWRKTVQPGNIILVCDIGGGTSDFTMIKVVDEDGNLGFERIAVGRHILLGGDNMDLTAAYTVAAKLQKEQNLKLDNYQITGLTHACRQAKEILMSSEDATPQPLTVLGRGSSVIGGTITTELNREELLDILLEGFFPQCSQENKPARNVRSGLRAMGLNYESDPAVTRHLAEFTAQHLSGSEAFPTHVLFNGGVTKAPPVRKRLMQVLESWKPETAPEVSALTDSNPDQAVALGACCYANVRRGEAIRIKAGSSHAYYVGIESSMPAVPGFTPPVQALCTLPLGLEEGSACDIPFDGLGLVVGETTSFRFFSSTTRREDMPGTVIDDAENTPELEELPPISATLPADGNIPPGSLIPVKLHGELTETGTLQLWCTGQQPNQRWKLEFELRHQE